MTNKEDRLLTPDGIDNALVKHGVVEVHHRLSKGQLSRYEAVCIEQRDLTRKAVLKEVWGELEDIRCCADGDYLSRLERYMSKLKNGEMPE